MGRIEGPAHADHVLKVIAGNDAASSALAASWRRSGALHALDPASRAPSQRLPEDEIAQSRERMGSLLFAAQGSIDRLFLAVGGVGCSVVLADPRGIIVDRRGAPCDDTLFDSSGLWTGGVWSEQYEGTNGIGTCIVDQRAVTIDRDQHFFTRNSGLFCTTAPIFDEHGDLAAALDVSSARGDLTEGFARLISSAVADAARFIEAENFRLRLSQGADPARANRRPVRVIAACGRPGRPRHRRYAGGADRARRQLGHAQASNPSRGSHGAGGSRKRRYRRGRTRCPPARSRALERQRLQGGEGPRHVARDVPPEDEGVRPARLTNPRCEVSQI